MKFIFVFNKTVQNWKEEHTLELEGSEGEINRMMKKFIFVMEHLIAEGGKITDAQKR